MPTQNRIGLDNEQSVLPERSGAKEQEEFDAIEVIELRMLALALEDDELLTQEGVFGDEIGFAASQVGGSTTHKGKGVGFESAFDRTALFTPSGLCYAASGTFESSVTRPKRATSTTSWTGL
ncbi:MAG: hypothetical protein U9R25_08110 [Chloroflexota bacterium]|nr:hypothetical protein [Chloroflexota bacterium]